MPDPRKTTSSDEGGDHGEFAADADAGTVPTEDWIPHPVSDSSDYLDREPPQYQEEDDEGA